jgi:hypothetical protein
MGNKKNNNNKNNNKKNNKNTMVCVPLKIIFQFGFWRKNSELMFGD